MKGPGQWAELGRGGGEGRGVSVYRVLGGLDLRAHRLGEAALSPRSSWKTVTHPWDALSP